LLRDSSEIVIKQLNLEKMKKLSLAELAAKANAVTNAEALNAIKGGELTLCHDGKCDPKVEPAVRDNTNVQIRKPL
jgi:hypothetical protein